MSEHAYIVHTSGPITLPAGGTIKSMPKSEIDGEQTKRFLGIAAKLCRAVRKHSRHTDILEELCKVYRELPTTARVADDPLVQARM